MKDGDVRKQLKANNRRKGNDNGLQKQAKGDDGRETREEEQERDIINCPKTRYEDGVESRPSTSPSRSFPWRRDLPLAPLAPPSPRLLISAPTAAPGPSESSSCLPELVPAARGVSGSSRRRSLARLDALSSGSGSVRMPRPVGPFGAARGGISQPRSGG